jgi:hypothetical protein
MIGPSGDISQCCCIANCRRKDIIKKQIKIMGLTDLSKIIKLVWVAQGESKSDDSENSTCSSDSDGSSNSDDDNNKR